MRKLLKSKKGFTLVELIVVIVIIAILAAALVVSLVGYIQKAGDTNALVEGNNVFVAAQAVMSENSSDYVSEDAGTSAASGLVTAVNAYLGKDIAAAAAGAGYFTFVTNDKATITSFVYTASNSQTVTYDGSAWSVS